MGDWESKPGREGIFSPPLIQGPRAHFTPLQRVLRSRTQGLKHSKFEAKHSPPYSTEVKNARSFTSNLPALRLVMLLTLYVGVILSFLL